MTVLLKNLFFGCSDGAAEANNYNDDLENLFYVGNNKYDEIMNDTMKFIVHGEKGTGKTILGKYVEKNCIKKGILSKIYGHDDLMLGKLIEKNDKILANDEAIYLFKWIIYVKIFLLLETKKCKFNFKRTEGIDVEFKEQLKFKKYMKKIRSIVKDRYDVEKYEYTGVEIFSQTVNKNSGILSKNELTIGRDSETTCGEKITLKKTEFYKLLTIVEESIIECLKITSIVVILDDLDEFKVKLENDTNSLESIKVLIEAIKSINSIFQSNKVSDSKCILLIRSDILNKVNKISTNMNKIICDNSVELYWIEKKKKPYEHMLMQMLLNKIKHKCPEYSDLTNKILYEKLFPETINKLDVTTYLLNHSFGRPRNFIAYLNKIRERYPEETKFTATMFKEAKVAYSESMLNELYNELKIHIDVKVADDYIKLIRMYGKEKFYFKDIKNYHKEKRDNFSFISGVNGLAKCLETLYEFGVIGNSWAEGNNSCNKKYRSSWGYRKDGNPNIDMTKKIVIHYGLKKILNIN